MSTYKDFFEIEAEEDSAEEEIAERVNNMEPPKSPHSTIGFNEDVLPQMIRGCYSVESPKSSEGNSDSAKGRRSRLRRKASEEDDALTPDDFFTPPPSMFASQESRNDELFEVPTRKNLAPDMELTVTKATPSSRPMSVTGSVNGSSSENGKARRQRVMKVPEKILKEGETAPYWMVTISGVTKDPKIFIRAIRSLCEPSHCYYLAFGKILFAIAMLEWGYENGQVEPHIHIVVKFENNRVCKGPTKEIGLKFAQHLAWKVSLGYRDYNMTPIVGLMKGLVYVSKTLPNKLDSLTYKPLRTTLKTRIGSTWNEEDVNRWDMDSFDLEMPLGTYFAIIKAEVERRNKSKPIQNDENEPPLQESNAFHTPSPSKKLDMRLQVESVPIREIKDALYDPDGGIFPLENTEDADRPAWLNMILSRFLLLFKGKNEHMYDKMTLFIVREGMTIGECFSMIDLHSTYRWFLTKLNPQQKILYAKFAPLELTRKTVDIPELHNLAIMRLKRRYDKAMHIVNNLPTSSRTIDNEVTRIRLYKNKLVKLTRWLQDCSISIKTKVYPRNRHLWIYGAGSNGKTSFVNWLRKHYKCQLVHACDKYLLTELDYTQTDFYIFDEFNLNNHMSSSATITMEVFNNMMGHSTKDEQHYIAAHKDVSNWPDVNVKGTLGKTHPCGTFIFLTNIPLHPKLRDPTSDDILSNFKLRFSTQLDFMKFEKMPEEFCIFNIETPKKIDDMTIDEIESKAKDDNMTIPDFGSADAQDSNNFGY